MTKTQGACPSCSATEYSRASSYQNTGGVVLEFVFANRRTLTGTFSGTCHRLAGGVPKTVADNAAKDGLVGEGAIVVGEVGEVWPDVGVVRPTEDSTTAATVITIHRRVVSVLGIISRLSQVGVCGGSRDHRSTDGALAMYPVRRFRGILGGRSERQRGS